MPLALLFLLLDSENDLILKHKRLDFTEYPPENDKNGQILYPGKFQQLPEGRGIDNSQDRVADLHFQTEICIATFFPHDEWLFQGSGNCKAAKRAVQGWLLHIIYLFDLVIGRGGGHLFNFSIWSL